MSFEKLRKKFEQKTPYYDHAKWISDHLTNFYSASEITVFHEIGSLDFHLDIYMVKSNNNKFNILLTAGTSTFGMSVDERLENSDDLKFAEFMLLIPKEIHFGKGQSGDGKYDWILSMLKQTARFPHHYDTWIQIGDTIQADNRMEPYSDETKFVGAVILPSVTFDINFTEISRDGRKICIYSLFPLYKNELEYKLENGLNPLVDILRKVNTNEVLDLRRRNLFDKKSFWNKFLRK